MTTRRAFGVLFAVAAVIAGCGSAGGAGHTASTRAANRTLVATSRGGPNPPGQKGGLTVDLIKPGVYAFYCPLHDHRQKGMQGSVVVQSS